MECSNILMNPERRTFERILVFQEYKKCGGVGGGGHLNEECPTFEQIEVSAKGVINILGRRIILVLRNTKREWYPRWV